MKDGDANTALFHGQAGFHKRKHFIPKLMCEDQVVTSQEDKQNVMFDYFDGLLGSALPRAYTLDLNFSIGRELIYRHWTQQFQMRKCGIQ